MTWKKQLQHLKTNVYQYYSNSLISFTNIIDDLLLQLLILIKLKFQVPMSLFSIKMAPVPLDAETYLGEKKEYTQIIPETELIALTENNYIPLTQAQILLCAKIGYMYYCEYVHLLKKSMEHTCMSAKYYDQSSNIKVKQCKTIVTFDTIPESKILDAGNLLILSNLQKHWIIACKDISRVFEIEYSTYCICRASARPPALLPTTPCIPSWLEGRGSHMAPSEYHSLNGAVYLG